MKLLVDLRPALDGHSGIPQEARLLFSGLSRLPDVQVQGLIHSNNLAIERGLPLPGTRAAIRLDPADAADRLSRLVVSLQQGPSSTRFEHWRRRFLRYAGPLGAASWSLVGGKHALGVFDPANFKDFVWRAMFAKTLPVEDFPAVTQAAYRVFRWPWSAVNAIGVATGALGYALYPRLDTRGYDVMIAQTPLPARPSRGTQLVVRYHDAFPLLMPHTVKDRGYHRAMHFRALRRNEADGAWFACVSDATRQDLLSVMPHLESRSITIPNMLSHHFVQEQEPHPRVREVIWSRKNRQLPGRSDAPLAEPGREEEPLRYLLMVSTIEPRKNHMALLDAWELLRGRGHGDLQLVCVGAMGWDHDAVLRRFGPWLERGGLHLLEGVPAADLRLLYRHAAATVCPSFGEGFDFSGVEAMGSGGVVAASDIPVHRGVYADACEYFSPYAPEQVADALARLLAPESESRRAWLRERGAEVSARYLPERVLPQWEQFLARAAPGRTSRGRSE